MMRRLIPFALAVALAAPAAHAAPAAASLALTCDAGGEVAGSEAPDLHGTWDFLMAPQGAPSFGVMSIGRVGGGYGGALVPARTAPVVIRSIGLTGDRIRMVVASTEGDVHFDGRLSARGDFMCGTVTYHGGATFPMVAQKRPSAYRAQPQAERAR